MKDVVIEAQDGGRSPAITISALAEARCFFGHDIADILYAVGIAPVKLLQAVWDRVNGW